jgi:hypothetical protein
MRVGVGMPTFLQPSHHEGSARRLPGVGLGAELHERRVEQLLGQHEIGLGEDGLQRLALRGVGQHRALPRVDQLAASEPGEVSERVAAALAAPRVAQRVALQGDVQGVEDVDALPGIPQRDQAGEPPHGVVGLLGISLLSVDVNGAPAEEVGQALPAFDFGRADDPLQRPQLVFLAAEVRIRVDLERPGDLVARRLHLADPRPIGLLTHPAVDEERAEVRVVSIELLLHLGPRGVEPVQSRPLLPHPRDRLVPAPEAVAGDPGVVVGGEVLGMALEMVRHAHQAHLIEERRIPLEPAGEDGDDLGQSLGLVTGGIAVPQAGGGRQGQSEQQGEGRQCASHGRAPGEVIGPVSPECDGQPGSSTGGT